MLSPEYQRLLDVDFTRFYNSITRSKLLHQSNDLTALKAFCTDTLSLERGAFFKGKVVEMVGFF